jgi:hypothetical protein
LRTRARIESSDGVLTPAAQSSIPDRERPLLDVEEPVQTGQRQYAADDRAGLAKHQRRVPRGLTG